jgi:hypothetical protein
MAGKARGGRPEVLSPYVESEGASSVHAVDPTAEHAEKCALYSLVAVLRREAWACVTGW